MPQRRAESPIRIQPRAAPWVKMFQQTCTLKEQKEGERVNTSLAPVALTARQLVNEHTHPGCYPGLYSFWGFAPSLLITLVAAHSAGLFSLWGFTPLLPLLVVTAHYSGLFSFWGFAPFLLVTLAAAHCIGLFPFQGFASSLLITLAAAHSAGLFSIGASPRLCP